MSKSNYGQILKASLLTGGAQVVTMLCSFARIKVAALCVGAEGVGMLGLFNQSIGFIAAIAGLGLNSSAVREVAAAEGSGNTEKLAKVVRSLRILVLGTGLLGILICVLLSRQLSVWSFGDESQVVEFRILGLALLFTELSLGQSALLRGLGKIRELALQSIVVAVLTTMVSAFVYWFWRKDGLVASLVFGALLSLLGSWWYSRKVRPKKGSLSFAEIFDEAGGMLRLGLAFVWSSLLCGACTFAIGIMVRHYLGLQCNGFYQAAWGMSGLFVGIVLSAMGQDFFPRLTGVINRHPEACTLINQQTEVGILLALPGVVGTVALASWLVPLFYSHEFSPAVTAVVWFSFGCFGRIVAWPLSFVLIAKGESLLVVVGESVFWPLYFSLAWVGVISHGLTGVAFGFAAAYLVYSIGMRLCMGRIIGFRYTKENVVLISISVALLFIAAVCGCWIGLGVTLLTSIFCLRKIILLLGRDHRWVNKISRIPHVFKLLNIAD